MQLFANLQKSHKGQDFVMVLNAWFQADSVLTCRIEKLINPPLCSIVFSYIYVVFEKISLFFIRICISHAMEIPPCTTDTPGSPHCLFLEV